MGALSLFWYACGSECWAMRLTSSTPWPTAGASGDDACGLLAMPNPVHPWEDVRAPYLRARLRLSVPLVAYLPGLCLVPASAGRRPR